MADQDALLNAIEAAEAESYGSNAAGMDGQLSDDRAAALDAYFGRNTFPAPEGNSQVVSRDLFDTVEAILPSLTRIFAGADEVVKLEPVGPDDMPQAEQETMYLNHVVTQKNQWEQVFHDWAWDALVTKNAYCMAYWDDSSAVEYERYERQSDEALAMLVEDGVEVLEHSSYLDEETTKDLQEAYASAMQQWQMVAMQAQQAGQMPPPPPQEPPPVMLHDVKIRRTRENGKVCIRVLPPERCLTHQATANYTLEECDFFEYWEETTLSKLRMMGFDVPDDIDAEERGFSDTPEDQARDLYNEDLARGEAYEPSARRVRARMCWIRHDHDGDGIAEMQYCVVVGRQILYREECTRIMVASIVATPVPHRHVGLSIWDAVSDIQEVKTQMLRQGVDNLFHANNLRTFINEDKINLDDALVSRPGGVVRSRAGVQDVQYGRDISPIVVPNIFPNAIQGLEYMDQVRENRTGTNRYFTGTDQNALNKTAFGIQQLSGMAAQRVEQIARMMAPSVEYLFSCVHELILKHGRKRETIRLAGEWAEIDPSNWRKKRDLKISVGLGSGSRDAVLAHLNQVFAMQMQTLPLGITAPDLIYNTLAEMTKAAGFPSETAFWKKPPPPQPPQPPPEVMLEQMRMQFEAQQNDADRKAEAWKTQVQEQNKAEIAELQSNTQQLIAMMKAYMDEQKQGMEMQLEGLRAAHENNKMQLDFVARQADKQPMTLNVGTEDTKRQVEELAQGFSGVIQQLQERMAGSQTVGVERIRDPKTGKLIGGRIKTADGATRDVQIQ